MTLPRGGWFTETDWDGVLERFAEYTPEQVRQSYERHRGYDPGDGSWFCEECDGLSPCVERYALGHLLGLDVDAVEST